MSFRRCSIIKVGVNNVSNTTFLQFLIGVTYFLIVTIHTRPIGTIIAIKLADD